MASSRTVVLIDDDPDDHEIFQMAVTGASVDAVCVHYHSAETALEQLAGITGELPCYIFLDLNMPRMNGMQFLELVKKNAALSTIPVIIYSTSIMPSIKAQALQLGAFDFFPKPSSHLDLIKALAGFLNK